MAEQTVSAVLRPGAALYNSSPHHAFTSRSFDGSADTYDVLDAGANQESLLQIPLRSLIPAGATLTSVTYRLTLDRKDNARYCALKCALGYAAGTAENSARYRVTQDVQLPLSAYDTVAKTAVTQQISAAQSEALTGAAVPGVWISVMGRHRCHEIELAFEGVLSDGGLFAGSAAVNAAYVGETQARALYLGTTKIL